MVPSFNLINQVLSKIKINEASSLSVLNELESISEKNKLIVKVFTNLNSRQFEI